MRTESIVTGVPFADALGYLKLKGRYTISRAGWNGKGMYLYLSDTIQVNSQDPSSHALSQRYEPFIVMVTATGTHQPGWLASQADLLADDWAVLKHRLD